MTHEELIKDLDACIKGAEYGPYEWGFKALRAIAELHKPFKDSWKEEMQCGYCVNLCHSETGLGCEDIDGIYPCDTIEAIEEELK